MIDRTHLPAIHHGAPAAAGEEMTVELLPVRPDPFRAPGVPQRLVLVLHREGLYYVGTLSTWEYHEIVVTRTNPHDGKSEQAYEMVVDTSTPHTVDVLVRMYQRPTAARLVAELTDVLRGLVSTLAGRDRRMPPRPVRPGRDASSHNDAQPPKSYPY